MKLQTQFTVPNKALGDLVNVNKVAVLKEIFKKECHFWGFSKNCCWHEF